MDDYDLTKEEDVQAYLKNIETEYTYQCVHEKEPDGCHRLADFFNSLKKDEQKGSKLFKENCDEHKYGHSCFKYAGQRLIGKGVEANPEEGAEYFEKSCEYGYVKGCSNAGILYVDKKFSKTDYDKGLKYLQMACDKDIGHTCATIGTGHLLGLYGLSKDSTKAVEMLSKGCDLGSVTGCANLSRMYKIGDGVQRNDALSNKYSALARAAMKKQEGDGSSISLGHTS
ncbi:cytochrome c oxidase assembly factor 7B-like [Watersipora subatra]|uniref:cytochrome c oxidase assembly factor 7B-like n=1 Tax=Watersipora subatra TaxID=2589382 RepID=UPI00355B17AC